MCDSPADVPPKVLALFDEVMDEMGELVTRTKSKGGTMKMAMLEASRLLRQRLGEVPDVSEEIIAQQCHYAEVGTAVLWSSLHAGNS